MPTIDDGQLFREDAGKYVLIVGASLRGAPFLERQIARMGRWQRDAPTN